MSDTPSDPQKVSRRKFVAAVLAATAASAAGGAGLAWRQSRPTTASTAPTTAPLPTTDYSAVGNAATTAQQETLTQLAAARAENMRLQAELDAVRRRLDITTESQGTADEEIQLLRAELSSAEQRHGILAGLVALYNQLEDVDLGGTVEGGLNTMADAFADLVGDLPDLTADLDEREQVLAEYEERLPQLAAGREWLSEQIARLAAFQQAVADMLAEAVETAGPLLDLLQNWFAEIRKWLPFGMGNRAERVMTALTNLMRETPRTLEGMQQQVALPLDEWIQPEVGKTEPAVKTRLFKPLREGTLQKSRRTAAKAQQTKEVFQQELVAQTATALADRRLVLDMIVAYRRQHGLDGDENQKLRGR